MNTSLFKHTPSVSVRDNRGLTVRNIEYYRHPDALDVTDERITRYQYDERGALIQCADPRLSDAGLVNFAYKTDLLGNKVKIQSSDAGISINLYDVSGRPFVMVNGIGFSENGTEDRSQSVRKSFQYEDATLPGRILSISEQTAQDTVRFTERYVYAGNTLQEKDLNISGECISHYDAVGLEQTDALSITGIPLSMTRRLLKTVDNVDYLVNWLGDDASSWNDLLAAKAFNTRTTADATGSILTTTDAVGNLQRVEYDIAGLATKSWLTVKEGTEQAILASLTYSAAGQKLCEKHGNGIITSYAYEPSTHQLLNLKTERPADHALGAKVLQDLVYEYDPVGNVLSVIDDAENVRFWRNQKVVPENTYRYDSLYQLVTASGREMADKPQQSSSLPSFSSFDSTTYTNYTRSYSYDRAGNLTQMRHSVPTTGNTYRTDITVSNRNNRAVLSTLTDNPSDVDALFTAGGHQTTLQPGQHLFWTMRGELLKVIPVSREEGSDDYEFYRYNGNSQRVLKVGVKLANSNTQNKKVIYLPCLELRTTSTDTTETENLQIITVGEAGRSQVRLLHWTIGTPDGVANNSLRYSYDNLIGSSGIDVDGEGNLIDKEEYYPFGGTAVWTGRNESEASYKTIRYSGKERDTTGLYYYGYRYYQPWIGRWLSADPSGRFGGMNLYKMVGDNPVSSRDIAGLVNAKDLPDSILLAIGYKQGPYTEEQNILYGYNNKGQRRLATSGFRDEEMIDTHSPEILQAAEPAHNVLQAASRNNGDLNNLSVIDKLIIHDYSVESGPYHALIANYNLGFNIDKEISKRYSPIHTAKLTHALAKLPPYQTTSYRGALIHNTFYAENDEIAKYYRETNPGATILRKGDVITSNGFFSTSSSQEVASQFVFRQRFGNEWRPDTVLFTVEGISGRNITELTSLPQAEILLSPSSTFRVKNITRSDFGYNVDLQETNANQEWSNTEGIHDYQWGNFNKTRPGTPASSLHHESLFRR